jgi:hypothetical protein
MIDDLEVSVPNTKYMDDTTFLDVSSRSDDNERITKAIEETVVWAEKNNMKFNTDKTKEIVFSFLKDHTAPSVSIDGVVIKQEDSAKLLGLHISSDLKWETHVQKIYSKSSRLIYFLKLLKRAGISAKDMQQYYVSVIRPTTEYACQVWHSSLTLKQGALLESIQKRCLRLIYPECNYKEALQQSNLPSLHERREQLCQRLFVQMKKDHHRLHHLLPEKTVHSHHTRQQNQFNQIKCRTVRFQKTFVPYCLKNFK